MKKITCFFLILLLILLSSLSFAQKKPVKGPKIFLTETDYDFGYIPPGSVVSHIFQIKNIGDETLQIVKVRTGCACTYAPLKKEILAPTESTSLEVIFNSMNYKGQKTQGVAIFSTDTSNVPDISFSANIENEFPQIQVDPPQVRFDSLRIEKTSPQRVTILNRSASPLQIAVIEKPKDFIDFQISRNVLNPKEKAEIAFEVNRKAAPGSFQTNLTIDFQGTEKTRYTLPISGTVTSR